MRVLLFSTQWPEYMIELANALSGKAEVILMLPENHRFSEKHRELINSKVKFEPYQLVLYKSIRANFKMLSHILAKLWKHWPDILHIQSNGHRLFYWIFFLKPFKTKIVNTIHDPVKHKGDLLSHAQSDRLVKFIGKYFTHRYIVHADALVPLLVQAYRIAEDRVVKIPHGNFEIYKKFQTKSVKQDENMILFFGRVWAYKGLEYFIEAANIVCDQNKKATFYIVGAGEDISTYMSKIRYSERLVVINKRVSLDEAGQYFQKSALVVLPYTEATQSGVIPVAYAYSRPVVATKVGGLPEVVLNGKTGFLVESHSPEQIANKILYLLEHPSIRHTMGNAAYEFAKQELSWDGIADRCINLYEFKA